MGYTNGIYRTMLVSPYGVRSRAYHNNKAVLADYANQKIAEGFRIVSETLDPVIVDEIKMEKIKGRHQVLEDVYVKVL